MNRNSSGAPKLDGVHTKYISQGCLSGTHHKSITSGRGADGEMFAVKNCIEVSLPMPRFLCGFPSDFACPPPEELLSESS